MNGNYSIPSWLRSEDNTVSLYSSVRISRNFRNFYFPSAAEYKDHKLVEKRVDNILEAKIADGSIIKKDISQMDQAEILLLQKLRILPDKRNDILSKLKLYITNRGDTFLLINYIDHLTIFSHTGGDKINQAYKNCLQILDIFKKVDFCKDNDGRFLTASLDYFGSGMKCFSVLSLPFLRMSEDFEGLLGSLEHNQIDKRKFLGLDDEKDDLIIITNRDSFSSDSTKTLREFRKILKEFKCNSGERSEEFLQKVEELKLKCKRIINYEFLTFKDFMRIYYMLSLLRLKKKSRIKISELNETLGALLISSPKTINPLRLKKLQTEGLFEKIRNEL